MAEAGLLLSVVSLTFQVFSGCVKGYQLITDAKNMPSDCQYLRVRLKTEQYRLLDWAEIVQLDEQDEKLLISNSSKGLLLDVLDQQRRLLHQFGRLDEKYKKLSKPLLVDEAEATGDLPNPPPYSPTEEKSPTLQRQDTDFANRFPQAESLLKKSLEFAQKSGQFPRRFKWATFDRAKFENLVLKLTSFNDFMSDMLNHNQLKALAIKQTRTEFQIMQLNSSIKDLVQIFEAAVLTKKHERKRSRFSTNTVKAYMQARGLDDVDEEHDLIKPDLHSLAALAQFKALNSAMEDSKVLDDDFTTSFDLKHTASEIRSVELSRRDIKITDTEGDDSGEGQRVEGYYQPPRSRKTSVWIEWKTYEPPTFHSSGPDSKILERVQKLAALLKENNTTEFRAPHCLGYFNDIDLESGEPHCRFGLVFEKPSSAHPLTRPVSLHALLTSSEVDMPSLTDRITLMQHLSETLERLHAVNWLHKGLRSSNVLFFSDSGPNEISYAEPYLSGFDYSRPAMNDDMTEKPPENAREDIYRHPRVQGSGNRDTSSGGGYKKSYDIYSLGVIFLEVAYWKPIEQILDIKDLQNARPSVTIKARQRLLDEKEGILRFVKGHLGMRIEGVVKACLEGPGAFGVKDGLDEKTDAGGAQLGKGFYREVVQVLGDMRV
ncbi:prion-inhibition and propagation-domain-containing protein [Lophiotrema nucula]|uniref:Prion-inhibition and propagation-domain-containing protein n=1 Tax=Lophiotrema nucula TaxID=690887 RepID=A0A6A5ZAI7_9PLEO|nr:prion-inhibition and propagation-domain-containing protein [Lophiotrema nucula]